MCAQAIGERTLKGQLAENERIYRETGHLFGLQELSRKQQDPGTYEAVYQILLNICNTGWAVGCQVSSSPIAVEGGDAMWSLNLPTGECVCTSRGITGHTGMLAAFIRSLVRDTSDAAGDRVRILYGGSVKPDNAAELLGREGIDGALVGGASLEPEAFATIAAAART